MRIVTAFWIVCATACAASKPPLAAPSSLSVDPLSEVVAVPSGACPGMGDHFAMSANAVRQLLLNMEQTDTDHALAMQKCGGERQLAEQRQKQAEDAAEANAAWRTWAPVGGVVAFIIGAVVGGVVGSKMGEK